tara:strand:+ start:618 stop:1019 length:402 start_codon:yes stop_codon:yes gene_type:complete
MSDNNIEIFKGKTFQDLTKDIYDNTKSKKLQLDLLVQEIHGFIRTIDDAIIIAPIVKELFEVSVKNDEHLVKLASVLQRILTRSTGATDDQFTLTDAEKEDLITALQETANDVQLESDRINQVSATGSKLMDN